MQSGPKELTYAYIMAAMRQSEKSSNIAKLSRLVT